MCDSLNNWNWNSLLEVHFSKTKTASLIAQHRKKVAYILKFWNYSIAWHSTQTEQYPLSLQEAIMLKKLSVKFSEITEGEDIY